MLGSRSFKEFVGSLIELIYLFVPLIFAIIFLVIAWRVIDAWIIHGGDETKVKAGKQTAIVGVIVMVVLLSVWGIVELVSSGLGLR